MKNIANNWQKKILPNIYRYKDEINNLIDYYYSPYLTLDASYFQTGIKLFSLYVLAKKDEEFNDDDLEFCNDIVQQYTDFRNYNDRSIDFYNLLFVKATLLKKRVIYHKQSNYSSVCLNYIGEEEIRHVVFKVLPYVIWIFFIIKNH